MASYAVNGTDIGLEICQKLGLMGQMVRKITITIPHDDFIIMEVTRIMTNDQADALIEVITKYKLTEIKDGKR